MRAALVGVLLSLAVAVPAGARTLQTVSKTFSTGNANAVRVKFPAGDLTITPSEDNQVSATMTARCEFGGYGCLERAQRVRLVSDMRGRTLCFKLEGMPKFNLHGLDIGLELRVPRSLGLKVEMGAGDLNVRGLEDDVVVSLGAGDATLRLPERAVESVRLGVGVGDVSLRRKHERYDGSAFISRRLRWLDGPGAARVQVHLGAGDVDVTLD